MSAPAKEKVYRWYKRGTHKVRDEKRRRYLTESGNQKHFSTVRLCQFADVFGNIELRAIPLSLHAINGPDATRRFNEMVADQAASAQSVANKIRGGKEAASKKLAA